jgi:hypothetical protein
LSKTTTIEANDITTAALKDNWDDTDGYYRAALPILWNCYQFYFSGVRIGEQLDGRYRVYGIFTLSRMHKTILKINSRLYGRWRVWQANFLPL